MFSKGHKKRRPAWMESAVFEFRLFEAADSFLRAFREEPGVRIADALRDELYVRRGAFEVDRRGNPRQHDYGRSPRQKAERT